MIFDKEIKEHLMIYVIDHPQSISFPNRGEDLYFTICGNLTDGRWDRDSFRYEFYYNKEGKITEVNGIALTIDMTDFENTIREAVKMCFKIKKKKTSIRTVE